MLHTFHQKNKKFFLVILFLVSSIGVARAATFTPPKVQPPGNNPDAPITATSTAQIKAGPLKVTGSVTPVAKVSLEVGDSTGATGGFLFPRVTTAQRNGLAPDGTVNAALTGLTVYNTQLKQPETFNGTNWIANNASTTNSIEGPAFFAYLLANTSGAVGWNDLGALGDFDPQASFVAPEFATPSADFTSATGVFKPSVPGKYLLTFTQWSGYGVAICKNAAAPSGASGAVPAGCAVGWSTTNGAKVTAIFDANGVTDSFKVYVYLNSGQSVSGGTSRYSAFSGSRVGNPVVIINQDNTTQVQPPTGSVVFFNLPGGLFAATCPVGWTKLDGTANPINMQGMYAVGSLGTSVGQYGGSLRLSNTESRATGMHTHSIPPLGVNNLVEPGLAYTGTAHYFGTSYSVRVGGNAWPEISYNSVITDGAQSTGGGGSISGATTIVNGTGSTGAVAGTNAPYVQFLACQKN